MKKLILPILCFGMFIGASPVYAESQNITKDETIKIPIVAEISSSWTVSVPKTIDVSSGTATYNVTVTGDIASNEKLKVTPSSNVAMSETNTVKPTVNATVTQDKTEWNYTDVSSSTGASGMITADLSAGSWTGNMEFNILLETVLGV